MIIWAAHLGAVVLAVAAISAVCFVAYLIFLGFVIVRTGSTTGLRDVAAAVEAYKGPLLKRAKQREHEEHAQ